MHTILVLNLLDSILLFEFNDIFVMLVDRPDKPKVIELTGTLMVSAFSRTTTFFAAALYTDTASTIYTVYASNCQIKGLDASRSGTVSLLINE